MTPPSDEMRKTIFKGWRKGMMLDTLAEVYDLPLAEVTEIVDAEKALRPLPFDRHPRELLQDHFLQLDALIETLASAASKESGGAKVKALTAQLQALIHRLELSQAIGLLPESGVGIYRFVSSIQLGNQMLDLLDDHGVLTVEMMDAIAEQFSSEPRLRELAEGEAPADA